MTVNTGPNTSLRRRRLLATAAAVTTTTAALAVAVGANFGLFGLSEQSTPVGRLAPIDATAVSSRSTVTSVSGSPISTSPSASTTSNPNGVPSSGTHHEHDGNDKHEAGHPDDD